MPNTQVILTQQIFIDCEVDFYCFALFIVFNPPNFYIICRPLSKMTDFSVNCGSVFSFSEFIQKLITARTT